MAKFTDILSYHTDIESDMSGELEYTVKIRAKGKLSSMIMDAFIDNEIVERLSSYGRYTAGELMSAIYDVCTDKDKANELTDDILHNLRKRFPDRSSSELLEE